MYRLDDLQQHHLTHAVKEMYGAKRQSKGQDQATERSWLLTAAAYADEVVCRVLECDPENGTATVPLWKDKGGNTVVATLAQAERDAYDLLKWRAENSPNPFSDNGNRWYMVNRLTRAGQDPRSGVFR